MEQQKSETKTKKKFNLAALFAPTDMTEGSPGKRIVAFAIPMLIGNIAQQLYNTVDSIVVGRYVGDNALAAVGSASPILNLLLVLFVGISVGASIMVSQYFGAKQREELSGSIGCSITLTAISSVIIMVVAPFVVRPLLRLLNTPDSIMDWCASYLIILFVGIAGMAYYNILSGILRGLGDSVSALVYLLVWLGRWVGWYAEVSAIRERLGLAPGPSLFHWRETLPYVPFAALLCLLLPFVLRLCDAGDVPVLSGLLYPYLLLPVGAFCSALSLGKRQGFCPLYPVVCAGLLFCFALLARLVSNVADADMLPIAFLAALVGNLAGAALRRRRGGAGE